tara:strand:- start:198 stop:608 length:411 start_codon:yes stop_codon:yes gene_type:complete
MAHFAELDENNIVTRVLVVNNEDILDGEGQESESVGVSFLQNLFGSETTWKQCSYHGNIRCRYPGVGFSYNSTLDAFINPQPFPSWTLNTTTKTWQPPIVEPDRTDDMISNNQGWIWNENAYQADNTTGWILSANI